MWLQLISGIALIQVLIVDDHALVRMGIRRLLEALPDVQVMGEAHDGETALKFVRSSPPDVVLLDLKMPGVDGWEVTRRLSKSHPNVKVIGLTAIESESFFPTRLLQLGAMGYLTKESSLDEMAIAIRQVYKGIRYISSQIAQKMALGSLEAPEEIPFDKLSEREMQVMLMITRGVTVQEIAQALFLTPKTVNSFRYRIFEKLKIKNDVELTHLAIKYRIIEQPADLVLDE